MDSPSKPLARGCVNTHADAKRTLWHGKCIFILRQRRWLRGLCPDKVRCSFRCAFRAGSGRFREVREVPIRVSGYFRDLPGFWAGSRLVLGGSACTFGKFRWQVPEGSGRFRRFRCRFCWFRSGFVRTPKGFVHYFHHHLSPPKKNFPGPVFFFPFWGPLMRHLCS